MPYKPLRDSRNIERSVDIAAWIPRLTAAPQRRHGSLEILARNRLELGAAPIREIERLPGQKALEDSGAPKAKSRVSNCAIFVPYARISAAWLLPMRPVMPCTITGVERDSVPIMLQP